MDPTSSNVMKEEFSFKKRLYEKEILRMQTGLKTLVKERLDTLKMAYPEVFVLSRFRYEKERWRISYGSFYTTEIKAEEMKKLKSNEFDCSIWSFEVKKIKSSYLEEDQLLLLDEGKEFPESNPQ